MKFSIDYLTFKYISYKTHTYVCYKMMHPFHWKESNTGMATSTILKGRAKNYIDIDVQ